MSKGFTSHTDNGPHRDVSPEATPSHTKPDPHLSDDPLGPSAYEPYKDLPRSPHFNHADRNRYWDNGKDSGNRG